jgi:hypothetical protein
LTSLKVVAAVVKYQNHAAIVYKPLDQRGTIAAYRILVL